LISVVASQQTKALVSAVNVINRARTGFYLPASGKAIGCVSLKISPEIRTSLFVGPSCIKNEGILDQKIIIEFINLRVSVC